MVEQRLESLGYRRIRGNAWRQGKRVVHVVHSSEFGGYIRVVWRDEWENHHAIIYDYSSAGGSTCIVPVRDLFMSDFVTGKRREISYANSGYLWSQRFPLDHELGRLVIGFKERWDLLR